MLFELVYDQPSQRRAYIEKAIKNAKPAWGYAYLTSLIENKIFNVIFTTNFDDLINEACYIFTNSLRPMVCAHDSAVSSVRLMSDRPKVIKLHGDFLYDSIKNTSSELQNLEVNMRDKFMEFVKECGLIVIGYSGNDQSVMDLLDILIRSDNYFRNGIYWCVHPSFIPSRRLRQLLRNNRIYWIEIDSFDDLMVDIADATNTRLPHGVLSPHRIALDNTKHLIDAKESFKNPTLSNSYSDLKEIYTRIEKALNNVGLGDWLLRTESENIIDEMKEKTLPFMKCQLLIEKEQYEAALDILRDLLKNNKSSRAKNVWRELLRCLLIDPKLHDEAKRLLSEMPPDNWQDSVHYLERSYFSLYLNLYEDALSFANRALELNSELTPAKINKAIALLIGKKEKDFKALIKELKSEKYFEHHRAAALALEGDFYKSMQLLQKSFVLGRYSPKAACIDVAFRVFWGKEKFKEKLLPFISEKNIKFPYMGSCPMSESEKIISENVDKILNKTVNK